MIERIEDGATRKVRVKVAPGVYPTSVGCGKLVILTLHNSARVDEVQVYRRKRMAGEYGSYDGDYAWLHDSYDWDTIEELPHVPWYRRLLGLGPKNSLPFAKVIS